MQIVRETLCPGAVAAAVAERHEIGTGQLYTWRKQMLTAAMTGFAAVEVAPELQTSPRLSSFADQAGESAACAVDVVVEVKLPGGTNVRVCNGAAAALLSDVFPALDRR